MRDIIPEIRKAIEVNPMGHLPLLYRKLLAKQVKNKKTLLKLYFECAKKVYSIWEEEYPDNNIVYSILESANDYLYKNEGKEDDFVQVGNLHKNYLENIDGNAGAAGLTTLFLCYFIGVGANFNENYDDTTDDNNLEYEDRMPDFYASIAYSGGNPFTFEGNIEKRREFWVWYITTAEILIDNPDKPIILLERKNVVLPKKENFKRTQSYDDENKELIKRVIQLTIDFLNEKKISYEAFRLESNCVNLYRTSSIYIMKNEKEEKLKLSPIDMFGFSPANILYEIKTNMYKQAPKEGAWLNCCLKVTPQKKYSLELNYDDKDRLYNSEIKEDSVIEEFKKFPRSKEFTPVWWKSILGNKAKYLE